MKIFVQQSKQASKSKQSGGKSYKFLQPKLRINKPGDRYELEADRVADEIMKMEPKYDGLSGYRNDLQRKCTCGGSHGADCDKREQKRLSLQGNYSEGVELDSVPPIVDEVLRSPGKPLDTETRNFMESRFGCDFSKVRIHDDNKAAESTQRVNSLAYTVGNNIVFNSGRYNLSSDSGKYLLAHELAHTIQQGIFFGNYTKRLIVQRTTIGQILDEFFELYSNEKLWLMNMYDDYTKIVRRWRPVIDALDEIKKDIAGNCSIWNTTHRSDAGWKPGKTDPPVTDPNSHPKPVPRPPGTDPQTCSRAFIIYKTTGHQTNDLYTCSIGSFGLYVTVDSIDCVNNSASLKVWMYNSMTQRSFGKYAKYFPHSGMASQYMWWNWNEEIKWLRVKENLWGDKAINVVESDEETHAFKKSSI
jgi:hypothetical protein